MSGGYIKTVSRANIVLRGENSWFLKQIIIYSYATRVAVKLFTQMLASKRKHWNNGWTWDNGKTFAFPSCFCIVGYLSVNKLTKALFISCFFFPTRTENKAPTFFVKITIHMYVCIVLEIKFALLAKYF